MDRHSNSSYCGEEGDLRPLELPFVQVSSFACISLFLTSVNKNKEQFVQIKVISLVLSLLFIFITILFLFVLRHIIEKISFLITAFFG